MQPKAKPRPRLFNRKVAKRNVTPFADKALLGKKAIFPDKTTNVFKI